MKTMLMVVHEATLTGAPMLALTLLKWIIHHTDIKPEVLLLRSGPLVPEFQSLARVYDAEKINGRRTLIGRIVNRALKIEPRFWLMRAMKDVPKRYDFVYGNSIAALPALIEFGSGTRRTCAVHELTTVIQSFFPKEFVRQHLSGLDVVVAGSESVAKNLVDEYSIDRASMKIVHAFIESDPPAPRPSTEVRGRLKIDADTLVIGGVGTPMLRKGVDLLPGIAKTLKDRHPSLKFKLVWLGGEPDDKFVAQVKIEAAARGVSDVIIFCETSTEPNDFISMYDIFMLPSREDPFPLVAVTAAFFGKPIIAFEGSGGMTELLADDAGFLVPHLDIDKYVEVIDLLGRSPSLRDRIGQTARERLKRKYGSEAGCLALLDAIAGPDAEAVKKRRTDGPGR